MSQKQIAQLKSLEGRQVSVALADGSRIDDAQLISAGGTGVRTLWVFTNGTDAFIPFLDLLDVWESKAA